MLVAPGAAPVNNRENTGKCALPGTAPGSSERLSRLPQALVEQPDDRVQDVRDDRALADRHLGRRGHAGNEPEILWHIVQARLVERDPGAEERRAALGAVGARLALVGLEG